MIYGFLSVMEDLVDAATENNETLAATTASDDDNNYLQTVVSSTVIYIDNYLETNNCTEDKKSCIMITQALQKTARVCTNVETLRAITKNTILHKHPAFPLGGILLSNL